jgi:chromosome partitioning protein
MKTLAIVATKGGVGKTTLAVHLAVAAQQDEHKVLILDLDPQGSAAQWGKDRARLIREHGRWFRTLLEVRRVFANDLVEALEQAEADGFDLVIIDTPPHADFPAARAVEVADLVLVPTRPGYFDLHAAKATIALVRDLKARAFFVVNQVPHNNLRIADDAAEFLEAKGLARAPGLITALQPYVRALRDGLTAPELVPDGRHAQEIGGLWDFVKIECQASRKQRPDAPTRKPGPAPRAALDSALLNDPFADLTVETPRVLSSSEDAA